jgi:hypothetical protein
MRVSAKFGTGTKLAWLPVGVQMIVMSSVSIFTILQFNTAPLMLGSYAAAFDGLHCVRCNFSCSTNSSTERTRIEKPQAVHFDCRTKASLCTHKFLRCVTARRCQTKIQPRSAEISIRRDALPGHHQLS